MSNPLPLYGASYTMPVTAGPGVDIRSMPASRRMLARTVAANLRLFVLSVIALAVGSR